MIPISEPPCQDLLGEASDLDIVYDHRFIEEDAPVGDGRLQIGKAPHRLSEELIRLELRVSFRFGDQVPQGRADLVFHGYLLGPATGPLIPTPEVTQGFYDLPLMPQVGVAKVDQLGDFVIPLHQEGVDVFPRLFDVISQMNEAVEEADQIADRAGCQEGEDYGHNDLQVRRHDHVPMEIDEQSSPGAAEPMREGKSGLGRGRTRALSLREIHLDILLLFLGNLQEGVSLIVHDSGNQKVREALDLNIIDIDRIVEGLSIIGDLRFDGRDPLLDLEKPLDSLQIGVLFRYDPELLQEVGQNILDADLLLDLGGRSVSGP